MSCRRDPTLQAPGIGRRRRRRSERLQPHQLGDPADRDPGLLPRVEDLGELLDRREEHVDVEDEGDQRAAGQVPVDDQPGPHAEDDRVRHGGEELHEREVRRHQPLGRHPGVQVVAAQPVEVPHRRTLVDERLRLPDAREALLEVGVDDRDPLAGDVVEPGRTAPEQPGCGGQRHHDGQGAQAELEVEDQQGDTDADERHERDQRQQQAVLDQRLELVDVGRHPGHDPAGHLALVVVQREPLHLGPDPDPQREHDPLGRAAGHERLADLVHQVGQGHREVDGGRAEQHRPRPGGDAVVDAGLDENRPGQGRQGVQHDQDQADRQLRPELSEQPPQPEPAVLAGLPLQVDPHRVAQRPEGGDPLQELGRRSQVEPPAATASATETCPQAGRPDARGRELPCRRGIDALGPPGRRCGPGPRRGRPVAVVSLRLVRVLGAGVVRPPREQHPVRRAASGQLVVRAVVHDPAAVQHDDPVGQVQGRAPVSHEQQGAARQAGAQGRMDRGLGRRVDRAGRVVQDQHAWIGQQGPGQRDPLPLPTGEGQPPLTDHRVVATVQRRDEAVGLGRPGGGLDLFVGRVRPAVRDVGPDSGGEQEALLEHHSDLAPQRGQRDGPEVMPVDRDPAGHRVVEAGDQHRDRGRAAAARADEGDPLPRAHPQVDAAQHLLAVAVPEVDVLEGDVAAQARQLDRVRRARQGRAQVQQLEDALQPRPGLLPDGEQPGQLAGGRQQLAEVGREGQERPERDVVVQREPPTEGEDGHLAERRDRLQQRLIARLQPHRPHLRGVEGRGRPGHPLDLVLLLTERLDHPHAVDVLVDDLRHVALALLGVPRRREHPPPHPVRHHQQQRRHRHADQRQRPRQDEHDDDRQHQQDDVAAHDRQEAQQPLHERRVRVGPGHQLAGRHPVQVGEVHRLQVVVHVVAQVVLDGQGDPAAEVAAGEGEAEGRRGQDEQDRQPAPETAGPGQDHLVDDVPLDQRDQQLAGAAGDGGREGQQDVPAVPQEVPEQPAEPAGPAGPEFGHPASLDRLAARPHTRRGPGVR